MQAVSYVERLVASPLVACTWERITQSATELRIVPDACVDLVWQGHELTIAGPDSAARVVTLTPGWRTVGARLRPGAAGPVLGIPAAELRDVTPDAADVLGRDVAAALGDALAAGADPHAMLLRALELRGVREPDLRSPGSQPAPTLYALEILGEADAADGEMARGARAWIASIAGPDGGIPFAVPGFEGYPHAPWFKPEPGSFLTLAVAAALHAEGVSDDEWLARATEWCWRSIDTIERPSGYWLKYACAFLDAVPDEDRARAAVASLARRLDPSSVVPAGGAEGEALRPLDLSPQPESRSRALVDQAKIEAHLDAVESEQQDDGGWLFDWLAWSPAQSAAWRGVVTIRALTWLRDNGRL